MDINRILDDINCSEQARQLQALDDFLTIPVGEVRDDDRQKVIIATLRLLERAPNRMIVASRLPRFGHVIIPFLQNVLERTLSAEVQILAALALLAQHVLTGVPALLREIQQRGPYRNMAIVALGNAGVTDVAPTIIEHLRDYSVIGSSAFPTTADDEVLTMLEVLRRLRWVLPDDINRKFSAPSAPLFFRKAMTEYSVK